MVLIILVEIVSTTFSIFIHLRFLWSSYPTVFMVFWPYSPYGVVGR